MLPLLNPCFCLDLLQVLAEHAKLARAEEIEKEIEFCKMVAAERAHEKHMKHYTICSETLGQMVDMATTVGEYRSITEKYVTSSLLEICKKQSIVSSGALIAVFWLTRDQRSLKNLTCQFQFSPIPMFLLLSWQQGSNYY